MKTLFILIIIFLFSCNPIRISNVRYTDKYIGKITYLYESYGSKCNRRLSTIIETDSLIFIICGHYNYLQLNNEVYLRKNLPRDFTESRAYVIIKGYKHEVR